MRPLISMPIPIFSYPIVSSSLPAPHHTILSRWFLRSHRCPVRFASAASFRYPDQPPGRILSYRGDLSSSPYRCQQKINRQKGVGRYGGEYSISLSPN